VDHVTPIAGGGGDDENNLTASCRDCNFGKTDTILEQRFQNLQPQPVRGSPFFTWLFAQIGREDPIGDLAKDVSRSVLQRCSTLDPVRTYRELALFLRGETSNTYVWRAGWHAWREWNRGKPTLSTAITIADTRLMKTEERDSLRAVTKANGLGHDPISMETREALRFLVVHWQGASDSESARDEKIFFERAIKAVSTARSHEDLLRVVDFCPMYPRYGRIWLCDLAAAERDGRKVTIVHRRGDRDDGSIKIEISK
jgi:hypothetical protein